MQVAWRGIYSDVIQFEFKKLVEEENWRFFREEKRKKIAKIADLRIFSRSLLSKCGTGCYQEPAQQVIFAQSA